MERKRVYLHWLPQAEKQGGDNRGPLSSPWEERGLEAPGWRAGPGLRGQSMG